MKTNKEITELINGGEYTKDNGLKFYLDESGDGIIWCKRDEFKAFQSHNNFVDDWYLCSGFGNFSKVNEALLFMRELYSFLERDFSIDGQVEITKVKVIEKEVIKVVPDQSLLAKLEVYEGMFSRKITLE